MEERKHEQSDVSVRGIAMFGAGLFIALAAALLAMAWLSGYFAANQPRPAVEPPALARTPLVPPEPHLQVSPARELGTMRAAEDEVLNTYGWVDPEAKVVRIPIDRAMDLLIQREAKK